MTILSGAGVVGLVIAVAMQQPPAVAVPPGLVALAAYLGARHGLARRTPATSTGRGGTRQLISDRSYAVAYPILAFVVLLGLLAAFVAVHEAERSISESTIHAGYWAALGGAWLLPVAVQAWRGRGLRHPRQGHRAAHRDESRVIGGGVPPPARRSRAPQ